MISIILILSYFIFYQRDLSFGDPRWYLPLALGAFIAVSQGVLLIGDYVKNIIKYLQ